MGEKPSDEITNPTDAAEPEVTQAAIQGDSKSSRLVDILDTYLAELERGETPDKAELLAANPSIAGELEACLAGLDFIHGFPSSQAAPPHVGDFRILREIGCGGMGTVYEAEQKSLQRRVALKVLRVASTSGDDVTERFQREAETLADLHHTNIVPIFAVGRENRIAYFAMQFIDGPNLAQVLADQSQPLDPMRVVAWGLQAAEALAHAHRLGVIHRDVKPSNLLLGDGERVWLTDFGLAKRLEDVTLSMAGALLGTPRYMSPEQASLKDDIDHRTDVYSLGAALYELVTGQPVFDGDTVLDVITQIIDATPVPPGQLRPDLPRDLEAIILKCLAKDPESRYGSADELAEDLRALQEGRPIRARQFGMLDHALLWLRRQQQQLVLAGGSAAVALTLVLCTVLGWSTYRDWNAGQLLLATSTPRVVAEILADEGRVREAFAVPNQYPCRLPPGDYRLRLSAPEQLSEDLGVSISRGMTAQHLVELGNRQMWPPLQVPQAFEIVRLDERADMLLLDDSGIECLHGGTADQRWSLDLTDVPSDRLPPGFCWQWQGANRPSGRGKFDRRPRLLRPAPDLDLDGVGDLVWSLQHQATVLAVSGQTGEVLWCFVPNEHDSQSEAPGPPTAVRSGNSRDLQSTIVHATGATVDVNGDRIADLLALWAETQNEGGQDTNARYGIAAMCGKTGAKLWNVDIDPVCFQLPDDIEQPYENLWFFGAGIGSFGESWQSGRSKLGKYRRVGAQGRRGNSIPVPTPLRVTSLDEKCVATCVAGSKLLCVDVATGRYVGEPLEMERPVARPPQMADVDADGTDELIVLQPSGPRPQSQGDDCRMQLAVWSLALGRTLWPPVEIAARSDSTPIWSHPKPEWPWIVDLDGQAGLEIVVPSGTSLGAPPYETGPYGGILVLEGKTGERLWQRRLSAMDQQIDWFVPGPDVNEDGHREIFTATLMQFRSRDPYCLFVDALSGKDGSTLWWNQQEVTGDFGNVQAAFLGPLRWGQAGPDGWPQLFVSLLAGEESSTSFVALDGWGHTTSQAGVGVARPKSLTMFSAGTGQVTHVVPDVTEPILADGNADGLADLFFFQHRELNGFDRGGTLTAIAGDSGEPWRHLGGRWRAAADLNVDGVTDLLEQPQNDEDTRHVAALDGQTGHVLWRTFPSDVPNIQSVQVVDDLNGDETPDVALVVGQQVQRGSPLRILSGRTGRPCWSAGILVNVCRNQLATEVRDLDHDGTPEVIFLAALDLHLDVDRRRISTLEWSLWLTVFSGRDGSLRWQRQLSTPLQSNSPLLVDGARLELEYLDANGDGCLDIAAPAIQSGEDGELQVIDGRDGQRIWGQSFTINRSGQRLLYSLPTAVVGDLRQDGTDELVLLDYVPKTKSTPRSSEHVARVRVFDASTGRLDWTWREVVDERCGLADEAPTTQAAKPVPVILRQGADRDRVIALGLWGQPGQVVALTADGEECFRTAVDLHDGRETSIFKLWHGDMDGDDVDELLVNSEGRIRAIVPTRPQACWEWSSPTGAAAILDVQAEERTVVVATGQATYGLEGRDGIPKWFCPSPPQFSTDRFRPKMPMLLDAGHANRCVFDVPNDLTICRAVQTRQAATADGDRPRGAPITTPGAGDPRRVRPLPWDDQESQVWRYPWAATVGCTLMMLVFPAAFLYALVRNRRWSLRTWLLLPAVCMLFLAALQLPLGISRQGLSTAIWARFGIALIGLPAVTYLLVLAVCGYRRQWGSLIKWILLVVILAVIIAVVGFLYDAGNLGPGFHYSWRGWYLPLLIAGNAVGFFALLTLPLWGGARFLFRVLAGGKKNGV